MVEYNMMKPKKKMTPHHGSVNTPTPNFLIWNLTKGGDSLRCNLPLTNGIKNLIFCIAGCEMIATGIFVEMVEVLTKATEAYRGARSSCRAYGGKHVLRKAANLGRLRMLQML